MFRCQLCNKVSEPYESPVRIVTKTREKEYYYKDRDGNVLPVKPSVKKKRFGDVAKGIEIVEERNVCEKCAERQEI